MSLSAARFRYTLAAGAAAVLIGAALTATGLTRHADRPIAAEPVADTAAPAPAPEATEPSRIPLPDPTTTAAKPKATTRAPHRKPKPSTATPKLLVANPPATTGPIVDQVLDHINMARAQAGLPAYVLSSALSQASALHNELMINGCGLAHECPGEDGIGDRFSAQGVRWNAAGENIGFGSAGAGDDAIVKAANGLTDNMLAEVAPNDGHKKNLLSTRFGHIGLSVVRDGKGVVWVTQDFVN